MRTARAFKSETKISSLKQLSYLRNMIYNMYMYLMIFPQLKKRFFVFPLHYSVTRKQNYC